MTAAPSDLRAAIAHARHELRTPVNAILGYSEMLIEEAEDLAEGDCLQILQETHALGQQLNAAITRILGEPEVERLQPAELPALEATVRATLQTPSQGVLDRCALLLEQTDSPALQPLRPDLQRIRTAAGNLLALLEQPGIANWQLKPASVPETETTAPKSITSQQPWPAGPVGHILIVDDNALNRDMLARLLARQQHTHEMAGNGRQALELLAARSFDLVLLDIMMPEMDGFETLRRIKDTAALKHIPVIMISAVDEISSVVRCIEMGAEDYLPKPFDPVLLRARVGACLEKKRLRDQELDYLRQVAVVTEAAVAIENSSFQPDPLEGVAQRGDPLGQLARVFLQMAREVQAREQRLKQQVQQLRVEIDEVRKTRQVAEITESDYFQTLQQKAQALRRRPPAGK
jgi:DNA-binding response OmpR family regulator